MIGTLGSARWTALKSPRLGVVPPPRPRLAQSSRRSAPPLTALIIHQHASDLSYNLLPDGRLYGIHANFDQDGRHIETEGGGWLCHRQGR
jgi:hypothetical protein